MSEAQMLILVKNDSTISGYHLYWLPDLGFLRFSLVDYGDAKLRPSPRLQRLSQPVFGG